tara:strand:- start:1537 stop:1722 length:186 start_codon:yes stop_codon:yes gene_type:complete
MNWKYIILATVLLYFIRGDEWLLYFGAYADYCYKIESIYHNTVNPGRLLSCFSGAAIPLER